MYVFTCPNPDCRDVGVERLFDWEGLQQSNAEQGIETGPVYCSCGTDITDTGRPVPDDYVPPPPPPPDESEMSLPIED